jgi:hypothetical protein
VRTLEIEGDLWLSTVWHVYSVGYVGPIGGWGLIVVGGIDRGLDVVLDERQEVFGSHQLL